MMAFEIETVTAVTGYRTGSGAACPDCGKSHWLVGRSTAECASCATALPIREPVWQSTEMRAPSGFRYRSISRG